MWLKSKSSPSLPKTQICLPYDNMAGDSISTSAFNCNGSIFAYTVSYDWSKGHVDATSRSKNDLVLHRCKDEEVKKHKGTPPVNTLVRWSRRATTLP